MRIHFQGAAGTTTGSMHLVEANGSRVLLDCGLYQGRRKEAFERNRNIAFDTNTIDACVLSHAHIDHSGNLPTLIRRGFAGRIHATPATRDLCAIMLRDSAHLQARDVRYVNKRRRRAGQRPFEPLYSSEDARKAIRRFKKVPYSKPTKIAEGVTLTFFDAGHILGSAVSLLEISENGRTVRLVYTGDLGRRRMPILRDPVVVERADAVITESTYGNRLHPQDEDVKKELAELCAKITENGSRLVIPAFSVGRTQQILYFLRELWREKRLKEIPIFVDSPLSSKATQVHEDHPECYDEAARALFQQSAEPFDFGRVKFTRTVEDSKRLNAMSGPVIIISASGMCEAGRVLHHLKNTITRRRNAVLIVGFQAEHTLGRRIAERDREVRIFGDLYPLRARVRVFDEFSSHADRDELVAFAAGMRRAPRRIIIVHGSEDASLALARRLTNRGFANVIVPLDGESIEL